MECATRITRSIVIIEYPRRTRSDLATAIFIQPIMRGGEVCMGTATTPAVLMTIWDLHIAIGGPRGAINDDDIDRDQESRDRKTRRRERAPPEYRLGLIFLSSGRELSRV